tara:strand:- start:13 stop:990 length:978 start_codon:yes stop_codon:yes gene_type:complete
MTRSPRVLHLNDCAFVGENLVTAAQAARLPWRLLPPTKTWAPVSPGRTTTTRRGEASTLARIAANVAWSQVVHVHFATTARRLRPRVVPRRPYVLHLHGTDIRTLWKDPARHAAIQSAIDNASHVLYSTLDNAENALAARSDAEYLPVFVDAQHLPVWEPKGYVAFCSRWEEVKGLASMLALAEVLVERGVDVRGLDWGPGAAEAASVGVKLVSRMDHASYLRFLAGASVVIGQATTILSVSEIEALAIGAPVAAVGSHLPGPDGRPVPIREGSVDAVAEAVLADLEAPAMASKELRGAEWARLHHTAGRYVPRLDEIYRALRAT